MPLGSLVLGKIGWWRSQDEFGNLARGLSKNLLKEIPDDLKDHARKNSTDEGKDDEELVRGEGWRRHTLNLMIDELNDLQVNPDGC